MKIVYFDSFFCFVLLFWIDFNVLSFWDQREAIPRYLTRSTKIRFQPKGKRGEEKIGGSWAELGRKLPKIVHALTLFAGDIYACSVIAVSWNNIALRKLLISFLPHAWITIGPFTHSFTWHSEIYLKLRWRSILLASPIHDSLVLAVLVNIL